MVIGQGDGILNEANAAIYQEYDMIWELLKGVEDPEMPLSIVELGIVNDVAVTVDPDGEKRVKVDVSPTFTGCPAWKEIVRRIEDQLRQAGISRVDVHLNYGLNWTPERISIEGRKKLREFGISIEKNRNHRFEAFCPYCGGTRVTVENDFGPTLCKKIYFCQDCHSPFEVLKALR